MIISGIVWGDKDNPTLNSGDPVRTIGQKLNKNFLASFLAKPFHVSQYPTPAMKVRIGPGIIRNPLTGTDTQVGGVFLATTTNGSGTLSDVSDITGIDDAQGVDCAGGFHIVDTAGVGTDTVDCTANFSGPFTSVPCVAYQLTGTISAPASGKKRIDLLSVAVSGLVTVTSGAETTGTPVCPSVPATSLAIAQIGTPDNPLLDSTTSITDDLIHNRGGAVRAAPQAVPTYTVASGVVTITQDDLVVRCQIDTEAAGSTDDVTQVVFAFAGQTVIMSAVSAARVPTIKNGSGTLDVSSDRVLDNPKDVIVLTSYAADKTKALLVSFQSNG